MNSGSYSAYKEAGRCNEDYDIDRASMKDERITKSIVLIMQMVEMHC